MKGVDVKDTRVSIFMGHNTVGKTSLLDAILFATGANDRHGMVDNGSSALDFDSEEKNRKISIYSKPALCQWNKKNLFLIDTPGYADFFGEVVSAARVADSSVIVLDAASGVQVGTQKAWTLAEESNLPVSIYVNRLDKENTDFYETLAVIQEAFGSRCIPVQIPVGKQVDLKQIIDLTSGKAVEGAPSEAKDKAEEYREKIIEAAAEMDDSLIEKYLEGESLSEEEIRKGIKEAIKARKLIPVLCGSATNNIGVTELLDFIEECMPSPVDIGEIKGEEDAVRKPDKNEPFSGLVFKTITDPYVGQVTYLRVYSGTLKEDSDFFNVNKDQKEKFGHLLVILGKNQDQISEATPGDIIAIPKLKNTGLGDTLCNASSKIKYEFAKLPSPVLSYAVKPKSKGDEEKISIGFSRIKSEDPSLKVERNKETKELVVSGMGDVHLEVVFGRLKEKFGVDVETSTPKVPYKETITAEAEGHEKHKKQSGGKGQYGEAFIRIRPLERGEGFNFVDKIVGGVIPKQYIPAVEKGILGAMENGFLVGSPVVDIEVELYFGSYHTVDSSEMAFKIAGSKAFQDAANKAKPVMLEPIMDVEITITDDHTGDIAGDLNHKRGRIMGMEPVGKLQKVKAKVPLAEMFKYATELRSMTAGSGYFTMEYSHYDIVPGNVAEKVIADAKKEQEE
ncbi:MAG: elongation factor G [Candidatus Theseobacter exili]|nr:elongation factor G [Candidatus Theseobacter exili]